MARKKFQFVANLKEGDKVNDIFAVKFKKPIREQYGMVFFEMRLWDKTGEISAKVYSGNGGIKKLRELYGCFDKDDIIHITGVVERKGDLIEIVMDENDMIRKVDEDEFDPSDFVDGLSEEEIKSLERELLGFVDSVENKHLNELLNAFFRDDEFMKEFRVTPAAIMYHQNYKGGLLKHTVNVTKICDFACNFYDVDRDLVISGALLHDIGKIRELSVTSSITFSDEGILLGHLIIGKEMVQAKIDSLNGFPEKTKYKLLHIIISHHGELIYGSPKKPCFPEAEMVYLADNMDATMEQICGIKNNAITEDSWFWSRRFNRHIYME